MSFKAPQFFHNEEFIEGDTESLEFRKKRLKAKERNKRDRRKRSDKRKASDARSRDPY